MPLRLSVRGDNLQNFRSILSLVGLFLVFLSSTNAIAETLAVYERDGHIVITNYEIPPNKVMLRISEYSLEPYSPSSSKGSAANLPVIPSNNDFRPSLTTSIQNRPQISAKASEPSKKSESKSAAAPSDPPDDPDVVPVDPPSDPPKAKPKPAIQSSNTKTVIIKQQSYYAMKTGKRYHTNPDCSGGSGVLTSLEDIRRRGLTACGRCM